MSYTFARFPADVELEGAHNYLANVPLDDYGPSMMLTDDDHDALRVATDDFCLSSLKVGFDICLLGWHYVNLLMLMLAKCGANKTRMQHNMPYNSCVMYSLSLTRIVLLYFKLMFSSNLMGRLHSF